MKQILIAFLLFSLCSLNGHCNDISVNNQAEFDKIAQNIKASINSGEKSILVNIRPGTYFFSECHILLENVKCPDVDIRISGQDVTILSKGRDFRGADLLSTEFSPYKTLLDAGGREIDLFSPVYKAKSKVKVVDLNTKLCMLKTDSKLPNRSPEQCTDAYIVLAEWFKSAIYKINYVLDNEICFTADDLSFDAKYLDYNVNADFYYGSRYPCFRVFGFNKELPESDVCVHESSSMRFIFLKNCSFNSFELDGVKVLGNWDNGYFLIDIANVSAKEITIANCLFYGIKSNVIRFLNSPNSKFISNTIENNSLDGLLIDEKSTNSLVKGNCFQNNGLLMSNSFCVQCQGGDYQIVGNVFKDFGYGGIAVGLSHYYFGDAKSCGVVEDNELFYTQEYADEALVPMDSGAIYLFTQNSGAVVRYNYIHSISGRKDNRGIFCDDGASNFKIYGNIIHDIENSYCIDSRLVPSSRLVNKNLQTNVNNYVGENLLDGKVRYEYDHLSSSCSRGRDYSFERLAEWPYKNIMKPYIKETRRKVR